MPQIDLVVQLNVEVSIASTKPETIAETPAIVSRFSAEDLERMGITSIRDMLAMLPGVIVQDAAISTIPIMIRGLSDAWNQKILLNLDGVPIHMSSHSDIPLLGIPFAAINHIEVIRGPGSVLYGTNASAGVINIVTKKDRTSQLCARLGPDQLFNQGLYWGDELKGGLKIGLGFENQDHGGYLGEYVGLLPSEQNPGVTSDWLNRATEFTSGTLRLSLSRWTLAYQAYEKSTNGYAGTIAVGHGAREDHHEKLLHINYKQPHEIGNLNFFADYNNYYMNYHDVENLAGPGTIGGFKVKNHNQDYRLRMGANATASLTHFLTFFGGIELERRSVGGYYFVVDNEYLVNVFNNNNHSTILETALYAQMDLEWESWRMLVGGRYVDHETAGTFFMPRLSLIRNIGRRSSLKLLYSEGANSPNFLQTVIYIPTVIVGDPNLKAEIVSSWDLGYSIYSENHLLVVNVYYLSGENLIDRRVLNPVLGPQYINLDEHISRRGFEIDFQKVAGKMKWMANLSYHHEGNRESSPRDERAFFAPRWSTNLGFSRVSGPWGGFGGSIRYIGERARLGDLLLLNLNYRFEIDNWLVYATVDNFLDESPFAPDLQDFVLDRYVNSGDGMSWRLGVKYSF